MSRRCSSAQGSDDRRGRERMRDRNPERFMHAVIHHRETAKAPTVRELVADEIDAPDGIRPRGDGSRTRGTARRFRWRRRTAKPSSRYNRSTRL